MDKIESTVRTGTVYLKELMQGWEEELFSMLIADKEQLFVDHNKEHFEDETHRSYNLIEAKVTALYDAKIIDSVERDLIINKFYELKDEYVKSKLKEVKL